VRVSGQYRLSTPGDVTGHVKVQIRDRQDLVARHGRAAAERAQPREQYGKGKRLGQVIVGAGVETGSRCPRQSRARSA
jgi:hypothetical protein